jgi:Protein of unknown function (DUF1045)
VPFHIAGGVTHQQLLSEARELANRITWFDASLSAVQMGRFVASRATRPHDDASIQQVAASALYALTLLRARPSAKARNDAWRQA